VCVCVCVCACAYVHVYMCAYVCVCMGVQPFSDIRVTCDYGCGCLKMVSGIFDLWLSLPPNWPQGDRTVLAAAHIKQ
jgi:hypothetical protein